METGEVEARKYRLADTDTEDFWDSIIKNKSFKEWVRGKYQFAKTDSNVPLAEVTEEEEDDE